MAKNLHVRLRLERGPDECHGRRQIAEHELCADADDAEAPALQLASAASFVTPEGVWLGEAVAPRRVTLGSWVTLRAPVLGPRPTSKAHSPCSEKRSRRASAISISTTTGGQRNSFPIDISEARRRRELTNLQHAAPLLSYAALLLSYAALLLPTLHSCSRLLAKPESGVESAHCTSHCRPD